MFNSNTNCYTVCGKLAHSYILHSCMVLISDSPAVSKVTVRPTEESTIPVMVVVDTNISF